MVGISRRSPTLIEYIWPCGHYENVLVQQAPGISFVRGELALPISKPPEDFTDEERRGVPGKRKCCKCWTTCSLFKPVPNCTECDHSFACSTCMIVNSSGSREIATSERRVIGEWDQTPEYWRCGDCEEINAFDNEGAFNGFLAPKVADYAEDSCCKKCNAKFNEDNWVISPFSIYLGTWNGRIVAEGGPWHWTMEWHRDHAEPGHTKEDCYETRKNGRRRRENPCINKNFVVEETADTEANAAAVPVPVPVPAPVGSENPPSSPSMEETQEPLQASPEEPPQTVDLSSPPEDLLGHPLSPGESPSEDPSPEDTSPQEDLAIEAEPRSLDESEVSHDLSENSSEDQDQESISSDLDHEDLGNETPGSELSEDAPANEDSPPQEPEYQPFDYEAAAEEWCEDGYRSPVSDELAFVDGGLTNQQGVVLGSGDELASPRGVDEPSLRDDLSQNGFVPDDFAQDSTSRDGEPNQFIQDDECAVDQEHDLPLDDEAPPVEDLVEAEVSGERSLEQDMSEEEPVEGAAPESQLYDQASENLQSDQEPLGEDSPPEEESLHEEETVQQDNIPEEDSIDTPEFDTHEFQEGPAVQDYTPSEEHAEDTDLVPEERDLDDGEGSFGDQVVEGVDAGIQEEVSTEPCFENDASFEDNVVLDEQPSLNEEPCFEREPVLDPVPSLGEEESLEESSVFDGEGEADVETASSRDAPPGPEASSDDGDHPIDEEYPLEEGEINDEDSLDHEQVDQEGGELQDAEDSFVQDGADEFPPSGDEPLLPPLEDYIEPAEVQDEHEISLEDRELAFDGGFSFQDSEVPIEMEEGDMVSLYPAPALQEDEALLEETVFEDGIPEEEEGHQYDGELPAPEGERDLDDEPFLDDAPLGGGDVLEEGAVEYDPEFVPEDGEAFEEDSVQDRGLDLDDEAPVEDTALLSQDDALEAGDFEPQYDEERSAYLDADESFLESSENVEEDDDDLFTVYDDSEDLFTIPRNTFAILDTPEAAKYGPAGMIIDTPGVYYDPEAEGEYEEEGEYLEDEVDDRELDGEEMDDEALDEELFEDEAEPLDEPIDDEPVEEEGEPLDEDVVEDGEPLDGEEEFETEGQEEMLDNDSGERGLDGEEFVEGEEEYLEDNLEGEALEEEPLDDEPLEEEPLEEEPLEEEPLDEEPLEDEPFEEEPFEGEPLEDEPFEDEPLEEGPLDEEPLEEEPFEEEPFEGEPFEDEPFEDEPFEEEPLEEEPLEEEPFEGEPFEDEPFEGEPLEEEPFEEEPFEEEPFEGEPLDGEAFDEEPFEGEPFEGGEEEFPQDEFFEQEDGERGFDTTEGFAEDGEGEYMEGGEGEGEFYSPMGEEDVAFEEGDRGLDLEGDEYADEAEPLDDGYSNQEYGNEEEGDRGLDDEFEVGQLDEGGEDGYDAGGEFNSDGDYAGEDAEGVDVEEYIDEGDLGPDDGFEDQPDDCGGFDDSVDGDEVAAEDYGGDGDMDEQGDGDEIGDADYGGESAEAEGYDYDDDNMGGGEADFGVEEREQDEVNDGDYDGGFDEGENIGEDYGDGNLDQAQVDWEDDIGGVDEPAAMDADDFDVGGHEDAGGYDAGFDDRGLDDSYGDGTQEDSFGGNDYGGAYAPQESFSSTSRNDTRGFDHASTNYQPDDSASFTTTDYPQDTQSDDHLDASFPAGEPGFDEPVYNDDNQEMERSAAPESEGDAPALTHEEVPDFEPESERVQDAFAVEEEEEEEQEDQPELLREGEELEVQSVAADEEESVAGYGEQIGYQDDDEDEARSLEEVPEQSFDDGQESHDDSAPEEDDQVYEGEIMHEDDEPSTGPMADDTWEPEPAAEEEEVDNLDYVLEQEDGQLPDVAHLNHESDYERDFDQELAGQSDNEAEFGEQTSVASEGFEASEDLEASGQLHAADDRDAEGLNEVFEVEAAEEREPDENLEYVPDEPETACIDQQDGAGFASDRDFDEHADRSQDLWDDSDEIPCVLETVDDDQVNFEIQEPPLQERPEIDYVPEEPEENLEIEDDRAISESANTGEPIQQSEFVDDEPTDTYMSGEQFDQRESVTEALEPESAEGRYDGDGWGDDYREEFATDQGLYEARDFPDPGSRAASAEPAPVQVHDEQFAVDDASEEIAHSPVSIADVYSAPASPAPEDEPEVAINESFGAESASFHDEISYPPPPQPEALATEQELSEPYEPQDDASDGGDSIIDSYSDPEMDSPMSMQEPFHQDPESFQSPQQARQSTHDQDQYSPPLTPVGDSFDDGLFPGYVNDHLKSPAVASNWGRQSQLLSPRAPPTPPLEDQDGQDYQERHELPEFQEDAYPYSVYDGSEYGPMTPPPDQDAPPLPSPHIIKDRIGALDDRQYQEDREESINEEPENFDDHIILDGHDILPSQQLAEENGGEPDEFDRDAVPEFPEPLFSKPSPKQDTAAFRAQTQPIEDIDEQLPHRSLSFSDEAHDSDLGSPELEYSGIDDEPVFEMMTSGPTGSEGHYEAEERDVYIQDELQLDQAAIEVDEPVQSPPLEQAKDHFLVVPVMMSPASGFEEHQDESPVHGRHQPHLIFAEAQPAQYYEKTVRSPEPMGQDVYQTEASEPEQVNSAVPSDTPQPEMYEPYDDYPYVDPDAIPEIDNSDMQPQAAVTSSTLSREGQVHEDAEQAPLPEEQPKREPTPHAPALSLFPKRKPVENPTNVAVPPNAETPPTGNRERGDPMAQMPYQANDPMAMNATPAGETGEGQEYVANQTVPGPMGGKNNNQKYQWLLPVMSLATLGYGVEVLETHYQPAKVKSSGWSFKSMTAKLFGGGKKSTATRDANSVPSAGAGDGVPPQAFSPSGSRDGGVTTPVNEVDLSESAPVQGLSRQPKLQEPENQYQNSYRAQEAEPDSFQVMGAAPFGTVTTIESNQPLIEQRQKKPGFFAVIFSFGKKRKAHNRSEAEAAAEPSDPSLSESAAPVDAQPSTKPGFFAIICGFGRKRKARNHSTAAPPEPSDPSLSESPAPVIAQRPKKPGFFSRIFRRKPSKTQQDDIELGNMPMAQTRALNNVKEDDEVRRVGRVNTGSPALVSSNSRKSTVVNVVGGGASDLYSPREGTIVEEDGAGEVQRGQSSRVRDEDEAGKPKHRGLFARVSSKKSSAKGKERLEAPEPVKPRQRKVQRALTDPRLERQVSAPKEGRGKVVGAANPANWAWIDVYWK